MAVHMHTKLQVILTTDEKVMLWTNLPPVMSDHIIRLVFDGHIMSDPCKFGQYSAYKVIYKQTEL